MAFKIIKLTYLLTYLRGGLRPALRPLVLSQKAGMVHSVSRWTQGVQVKLWDPLRTCAIPERLRGVFTTRCYTNVRLPLPLPLSQSGENFVRIKGEMKLQLKQHSHWNLQSEEETMWKLQKGKTGNALDPQWKRKSCCTWRDMEWKDGHDMERRVCLKAIERQEWKIWTLPDELVTAWTKNCDNLYHQRHLSNISVTLGKDVLLTARTKVYCNQACSQDFTLGGGYRSCQGALFSPPSKLVLWGGSPQNTSARENSVTFLNKTTKPAFFP